MRIFDEATGLRRLVTALVTVAMVAVGLAWGATPASAAVSVDLSGASGPVGVTQTVSAKVGSDAIGAPTGKVVFTADGKEIGAHAVGGSLGSTAEVPWVPTAAGPVTLQAAFLADSGDQALDRLTVQVTTVDTVTTISVPASAATSTKVPLQAAVRSKSGTYTPSGKVSFSLTDGTSLGSATLDGSGNATLSFVTPATKGTVTLRVAYAGDGNAKASTSSNASISVTATASTLTLAAPTSAVVGTAVSLTAKLSPAALTGTVDFSIGTRKLGTAKISNGAATLAWTPDTVGTFTITAAFAGTSGISGDTDTARVQVSQALNRDSITLDPEGSAGPWSPGTPVAMANGTSVTLGVVSTSRLPVQLAITGPCSLNGTTVTVKGVGGPCTLTASTRGGSGYAPVTQKYTIQTVIGRQTAHVIAPVSGSYPRGQRLRLGRLKAVTSVGQPVSWRVIKGGSRCYIVQTTSYYRLTLKKRGLCRVRGSAAGIGGQWAPFRVTRTYTAR